MELHLGLALLVISQLSEVVPPAVLAPSQQAQPAAEGAGPQSGSSMPSVPSILQSPSEGSMGRIQAAPAPAVQQLLPQSSSPSVAVPSEQPDSSLPPRSPMRSTLNTSPPAQSIGQQSSVPSSPPAELGTAGRRPLPPEMVAEALVLPTGGAITGRRVTLMDVLANTIQQQRQAEITHAYWRLAEAVAEYHFAFAENAAISQIQVRPADAAMLKTAQSSAAAALEAAEVAAREAQNALADAALLPMDAGLPLPADPPHVGPYRTQFDELFALRAAPPQARLIDRTLPIQRRVIDLRAEAVHAAGDALEAVIDAYREGRIGFTTVLAAMGQLGRQRQALIAAVGRYNHDIADYALAVVAPGTTGSGLIGMLIRRSGHSQQPAGNTSAGSLPSGPRPAEASEVQPAMHTAPLASSPKRTGQPTLAPPRPKSFPSTEVQGPATGSRPAPESGSEPTPAPPRELPELDPVPSAMPASASPPAKPEDSQPTSGGGNPSQEDTEPAAKQPADGAAPSDAAPSALGEERRLVPLSTLPPAGSRTALRPTGDAAVTGLYPALLEMSPAVRCKELAVALHWEQTSASDSSRPISLLDFLKAAPSGRRQELVGVYWLARQKAAEQRVFKQTVAFVEEIEPLVLERRQDPGGAGAMLRVRAYKLAVQSEELRARTELLTANYRLTGATGRPLDGNWLLPITPPHAGSYLLKLESQPASIAGTRKMQRLAAAVPGLGEGLQQRATAVVHADAARAGAIAEFQNGGRSADDLLITIAQQTDQTLAFLDTLTRYNEAIAEYAFGVLPATAPADIVTQTLVVLK